MIVVAPKVVALKVVALKVVALKVVAPKVVLPVATTVAAVVATEAVENVIVIAPDPKSREASVAVAVVMIDHVAAGEAESHRTGTAMIVDAGNVDLKRDSV